MNNKIEMMRILNAATPIIDWSYEFYDFSAKESNDFYRLKDPTFIHMDPKESSEFYLSGRYQGHASIMKF